LLGLKGNELSLVPPISNRWIEVIFSISGVKQEEDCYKYPFHTYIVNLLVGDFFGRPPSLDHSLSCLVEYFLARAFPPSEPSFCASGFLDFDMGFVAFD